MRRSKSIIIKPRPVEEEPKVLKKNVSATAELRMSPVPAPEDKYLHIPKDFNISQPSIVKILKAKYHPQLEKVSTLDPLEKVELERLNPEYQNKTQSYKSKYKIYSQNPMQDIGIVSIVKKIEERKEKFLSRYQKLFGSRAENYSEGAKCLKMDLANMRVPRGKGYKSQFYESVRAMLEKVD